MHSDTRQVLQWAQARGWKASLTGGGHWRLVKENCGICHLSNSPSDTRSVRNARSLLLRKEREAALRAELKAESLFGGKEYPSGLHSDEAAAPAPGMGR